MEENETTTSVWNKTTSELTVKDQLLIAVVAPVIVIGVMAAAGAAVTVAEKVIRKFRKDKSPVIEIVKPETN